MNFSVPASASQASNAMVQQSGSEVTKSAPASAMSLTMIAVQTSTSMMRQMFVTASAKLPQPSAISPALSMCSAAKSVVASAQTQTAFRAPQTNQHSIQDLAVAIATRTLSLAVAQILISKKAIALAPATQEDYYNALLHSNSTPIPASANAH